MHYYKKNIGDYAKKAGRLSMLQHGAYMLLIDSCYDREAFPTKDQALEWTWASSREETEAVEFVLGRFFTLKDGIYVQNRIQEEIDLYHTKAATNKRIAIEREANRKKKSTTRAQCVDEATPNHKPRTKNHKPTNTIVASAPKFNFKTQLISLGVNDSTARDWLEVRKKKKAANTETAFNGLIKQINKSGLTPQKAIEMATERSWAGFKSDWVGSNEQDFSDTSTDWVNKDYGLI